MHKTILLIVAHGSRRQASNDEVRQLGEQVRRLRGQAIDDVQVAFLELAEPAIPAGLAHCADLGADEIIVFPYFLAAGTHVAVDIPQAIAAFRASHPLVKVSLTHHLGASFALPHAILEMATAQEAVAA
jgi:sirohydrochlorin ferrochelatase